jgi:hypothetical protein
VKSRPFQNSRPNSTDRMKHLTYVICQICCATSQRRASRTMCTSSPSYIVCTSCSPSATSSLPNIPSGQVSSAQSTPGARARAPDASLGASHKRLRKVMVSSYRTFDPAKSCGGPSTPRLDPLKISLRKCFLRCPRIVSKAVQKWSEKVG